MVKSRQQRDHGYSPVASLNPATKPAPERPPVKWMNPMNKLIWIKAFRACKHQVKLPDGQVFNCDYKKRPGYVLVTPARGFIPRGWFELKRVTHTNWLDD